MAKSTLSSLRASFAAPPAKSTRLSCVSKMTLEKRKRNGASLIAPPHRGKNGPFAIEFRRQEGEHFESRCEQLATRVASIDARNFARLRWDVQVRKVSRWDYLDGPPRQRSSYFVENARCDLMCDLANLPLASPLASSAARLYASA